ncbi:MAG: PilX N-terminal domain-containing pilus assembly protein [Candidatus Thiodiazotropha sp. L084R]
MNKCNFLAMRPRTANRQKGAALVVSLILLTIITLLSVSSMRNTNIETKIAVNHQFKELSFQAAENALAIITGPELDAVNLNIPATVGTTVPTPNFNPLSGITDQADTHAEINMLYEDVIDPKQGKGNMLFSGFQLDIATHLYLADSTGFVDGNETKTTNRMQVALIRQ